MLSLQPTLYSATALLASGAKADTAAATSSWVDVSAYDGPIIIVWNCGTVTAGSIAGKIQSATSNAGANAADVKAFTTVTTSNDPMTQVMVLESSALRPFIAFVGTVTTGPVDTGVTMLYVNQYD